MDSDKKCLVLIGPLPPPHHGVTIYTEGLLHSRLTSVFDVVHLDTSDRRNLDNIGTLDPGNVLVALRSIARLKWLCLTRKPALVYLPNSQNNLGFFRDGLLILVARWLSRAKIVMHYHGGESFTGFLSGTNGFMRGFIRFVLRRVDLVVVVGDRLRRIFDGLARRTVAVHNGSSFLPHINGRMDRPPSSVTVSYLGNLFRSKGVLDLLEAAAIVSQRHPQTRFRFAGEWWGQEPETKEKAMEIVRRHNLGMTVEFVGRVLEKDKEQFLLETDIFAFPTWNDSFGLVNLEAMAAGCPVISTRDLGAIPEVVLDGETGILVEKQNPALLAEAITRLIEDPAMRRRLGAAGRKRFEQYFTQERHVDNMIAVFRETLGMPA